MRIFNYCIGYVFCQYNLEFLFIQLTLLLDARKNSTYEIYEKEKYPKKASINLFLFCTESPLTSRHVVSNCLSPSIAVLSSSRFSMSLSYISVSKNVMEWIASPCSFVL